MGGPVLWNGIDEIFASTDIFCGQVWGFSNSPISWGEVEHVHVDEFSGVNDYTLIIFPEGDYCLYVAAGKGDKFTKI